jgi:outer membrane protein TolC
LSLRRKAVAAAAFALAAAAVFPDPFSDAPFDYRRAASAAVSSSDELRAERALAVLRRGAWVLGLRAYFPTLTLSVGEDDRLSETGADSFSKSLSVSAEQLVWDGGRTTTGRRIEAAELDVAGAELERTARKLGEAAVDAYRSVLASRQLADIRMSTAESIAEQRRIMDAEARAGLVTADELAAADIELEGAEIAYRSALLDAELAELALSRAVGMDELPELSETLSVDYEGVDVAPAAVADAARGRNPELAAARLSIAKSRAEARAGSTAWAPTLSLTGSYRVGGDEYPLTSYAWSVGVNLEFSGPWGGLSTAAGTGREGKYDRTANASASAEPLTDPAAALRGRQAAVSVDLETRKYEAALKAMERTAETTVASYRLTGRKLALARRSLGAEERKYQLALLQADLGRLRRVDVMEQRIEVAKKAVSAVEAAAAFIAAERSVEQLMDLPPGGLADFARRAALLGK